jgi:CO/xanthine dehydrogenase FAD-binding subunit
MTSAEAALLGAIPNADTFQTAVEQLRDEVDSRTDTYATGEYRRQVAGTLVARALASLS